MKKISFVIILNIMLGIILEPIYAYEISDCDEQLEKNNIVAEEENQNLIDEQSNEQIFNNEIVDSQEEIDDENSLDEKIKEEIKENNIQDCLEDYEEKNIDENSKDINNDKLKKDTLQDSLEPYSENLSKQESIIEDEEFSLSVNISGYDIKAYYTNDAYYLFLPQGINISNMTINYTGMVTEVSSGNFDAQSKEIFNDFSNNNTLEVTVNGKKHKVVVMQTNLPSMSISLNGITLNQLNGNSKDNKYKNNSVILKNPLNSKYDFSETGVEIKGRGNFTWTLDKKSYQIKFGSKVNVLGMGKAKTWILLANHADNSLVRNKIIFDLAEGIGLDYTSKSEYIDLWIDGEYLGNYLITEKVQVGNNRIELQDTEGIVVELDNSYYYKENTYFKSKKTGTAFTLKDSVADDESIANSVAKKSFKSFENYINKFEDYLYSENKDWSKINSMIDVDSFVKFYLIQEFTEDPDGCRSSWFMYKDGNNDVIHVGPVWDYDSSMGNYTTTALGGNTSVDYVKNINRYMPNSNNWYEKLLEFPEFRKLIANKYDEFRNEIDNIKYNLNIYQSNLNQSASMNFIRWNTQGKKTVFVGSDRVNKDTYENEVKYLSNWLNNRCIYLDSRYGKTSKVYNVEYISHIQDYGWEKEPYKYNEQISGTTGKSKRVEAIRIKIDSFNSDLVDASIKYRVHVQEIGWMNWKYNGEMAGTEGQSKRIEAIQINLENAEGYYVQYRVHVQDIGWMDWTSEGEIAGTTGQSRRIEAIQIRLVKGSVIYNSHIQDIGWESNFSKKDGQLSGTEGQSLRLEGIMINLTGEIANYYDVYYRVHAQNFGWLDWAKNGEMAGTEGYSYRAEGIQIVLVKKGMPAPGNTSNKFRKN